MKKLLIIDDDLDMCTLLSRFLKRNGFDVEVAHSATKGLLKFKEDNFDIVLCDFRLGDKDGKDVLQEIKNESPETIVVIITGYSDIKIAVDVIKMGAYDYITKPLIPDEVLKVLKDALEAPESEHIPSVDLLGTDMQKTRKAKKPEGRKDINQSEFLVGQDKATKELYRQIDIVAPTNYSIILYGESGTGKEVIAKTIHKMSARSDKPFVAMDCGTLSKELSGSELFGHVKGAFTGALTDKEGHFEIANGGTLFLDELKKINVIKNYSQKICRIKVDKEKIKIAFLNIIVNAIEAIDRDRAGALSITTFQKENKCHIIITDNGSGMTEEIQSKVFEPYFTGKENGNGLGMTNTQNIILSHQGKINLKSLIGEGTTFEVILDI